jgi:hypothetical protein
MLRSSNAKHVRSVELRAELIEVNAMRSSLSTSLEDVRRTGSTDLLFLTSTLEWSHYSASRFCRFTPCVHCMRGSELWGWSP